MILAANRMTDQEGRERFDLPLQDYFRALPRGALDVGLVNFLTDSDGVVRRFSPALADDQGELLLTFARQLALRAGGGDPAAEVKRLREQPALLEGQTKELGWTIVASDATIKAAGLRVVTGGSATVQVKGRREPVPVWEVTGLEPG